MGMSKSASNLWAIPSVKRTFIKVKEMWFPAYPTDVLEVVNDRYIGPVLDDGGIDILK